MSTHASAFDLARRGRWYVRIIAAALVSASVWATLLYVIQIGPFILFHQVIRLALTLWLAYALLRAREGARWLTVILCVLVLVQTGMHLYETQSELGGRLVMAVVAVLYLCIGCVLLWSPAVDAFFAKRGFVSPPVFKDD
ncbi:hypothetical protein [Longimicrobium terrae]|uniref:Uncharacterized protein n=1 Tax=Longimicrobium terrae TaxID=1639882 RepID=A0A841H3B0_9BACT|nr:hypothetical protein [Longimicrobium terrae]MBB4638091.1 hypothetical protein [Longimicrobium terrae]MBB6072463.1 hypothetical protein [Longimicrobium terrae]NNC32126.1 hypothetical protein [Longimicrobium terrae]